jgi:hypothetical protein
VLLRKGELKGSSLRLRDRQATEKQPYSVEPQSLALKLY